MRCLACGSQAVTERPERTAQGCRRFCCRACGKQFNERPGTLLKRALYPSDVIALVVLWRLRYKLSLRDLPEMFAVRGIVLSYEAVREWEAKLTPALAEELRRRRRHGGTSSHFGFLGCGGVGWLGWGRLRRCSAGRARWRPSEGQGFQELGPGGEHNIGAQGLQVVEEAGSGSKRLAGVPPSA